MKARTDPEAARGARSLVLSGAFERRLANLERALPPPARDGWHRVEDPSPRIRSLLALARARARAGDYVGAAELYAEAEQIFWEHQPAL